MNATAQYSVSPSLMVVAAKGQAPNGSFFLVFYLYVHETAPFSLPTQVAAQVQKKWQSSPVCAVVS